MKILVLPVLAALLLPAPPASEAQEKPNAEEPFRWNLAKGQVLDVSLSVRHQARINFKNLTVAGLLTIESVDSEGGASGAWKIQTLTNHELFVNEEKMTYSGGRWSQVAHIRHVAFDAVEKAQKEAEDNRDFMERGKKWADAGGTVTAQIGPFGFSYISTCPVVFHSYLENCWPILKLPAVKGPPEKIEIAPGRTGHLFGCQKIDQSNVSGRWTGVGSSPVYLEEGTVVGHWVGMGGQKVIENLKYSRTTSASATLGSIAKVSETFTVSWTVDGKPQKSNTGTFSLTIARKK